MIFYFWETFILNCVIAIPVTLISFFFFSWIYGAKPHLLQYISYVVLSILANAILGALLLNNKSGLSLIDILILTSISILLELFLLRIMFHSTWTFTIGVSSLSTIISTTATSLGVLISDFLEYLLHLDRFLNKSNMIISHLFAYLLVIPLAFLLTIYLLKKIHLKQIIHTILHSKKNAVYLAIFLLLFSIVIQVSGELLESFGIQRNNTNLLNLLFLFISLSFITLSGLYQTSKEQNNIQKTFILQQQSYLDSLEEIQQDIRSLHHDYKNILSGLYIHADEGNTEAITKYMQETMQLFDGNLNEKIKHTSQLSNIHILEMKGLILSKTAEMEQKNITFNLEVTQPIDKIEMSIHDVIRCLGILLDNAIEAIQHYECDKRKITLALNQEADSLLLLVKNPLEEKIDMQHIWQAGFSTKGKNRGLGLHNYKNITDSYANIMRHTICNKDEFLQILEIANR
ncbi:sensor histidine kinase [Isobaculum melis]|uniref:Sensor histidine kinase YesM n=1 Tax=Isobaculum melis TaxID=142588 RepID=A0A1H9QLB9_9LACT|nr:GHKL domain-containing protein [Isobaculum melis]SER61228.1 Sensor histidine kinase YesM [Isobaculum melis]